ncbi:MAG: GDP-mannose 4,6-dehydratase [Acidobacteria bacterium]|nr:GDP-mannose 4,6-dehydratase [Acidobacteriota bacterium]MBI3658177.1 GDP-mannose 4,6-dehydratase [Acidobacteriota bacterium]
MKIVVTGGAGFIGTNLSAAMAKDGHTVVIFDNLSRRGTEANARWLLDSYPTIRLAKGDLRHDQRVMGEIVADADAVYHLAGQVAVTTSVTDPREDFEINALGTFNLLEAVRLHAQKNPVFIYSSTNKVYGGMEDVKVEEHNDRFRYRDFANGISEAQLLDFHSPYGCSKGAADQYVRDYSRIYGLRSVVFRQSCIYGPRQFGIEDQGWVAWFTIATLADVPITIYGNGKQVRDVLYIDDLVRAFRMATDNIEITRGRVYNVGGGPQNTMSLLELIAFLHEYHAKEIKPAYGDWRPGDQPVYISDISKAKAEFGWQPLVTAKEGVKRLTDWVRQNKRLFEEVGLI